MSKIIKLGMTFQSDTAPDFGSIEKSPVCDNEYTLLADDIAKLNSALTESVCSPLLADGCSFNVPSGANAFVADWIDEEAAPVYRYHSGSDHWYEVIPNE